MTVAEAMKDYVARGWKCVLTCPVDHRGVNEAHISRCKSPGKVPLHQWRDIPYSIRYLNLILAKHPNCNIGIITGKRSGVIGLDIDSAEGWSRLEASGITIERDTPAFRTGRGLRLLYSMPADAEIQSTVLFRGVDLLAEGKQTIMPPSLHVSGKQYCWLKGRELQSGKPLPEFPMELLDRRDWAAVGGEDPYLPDTVWEEGTRNNRLFRLACILRRYGAAQDELLGCMHVFNRRCQPPLEYTELAGIAQRAALYRPDYNDPVSEGDNDGPEQ